MPHTNDKRRFQEAAKLLGGPIHVHHAARVRGERLLDPKEPGQRAFQALLFRCFNSRPRSHPFDGTPGRSFADLRDCYISSVQLQFDPVRLVMDVSDAARVTSYLLPNSRLFPDRSCEYAGIPGLRVEGYYGRVIRLLHVPTGGLLDIADPRYRRGNIRRALKVESAHRVDDALEVSYDGSHSPIWTLSTMHPTELHAVAFWQQTPVTAVLSGMMSRANALWAQAKDLTVLPPRRTSSMIRLDWRGEFTNDDMISLLTRSSIRFREESRELQSRYWEASVLRIGATQIELDGPMTSRLARACR